MADAAELVNWLHKAKSAIYSACDEAVADDISPKLGAAAARIETLSARVSILEDINLELQTSIAARDLKIARLAAKEAECERLRKAIEDFLSGDYPNPRDHRPNECEHGTLYYEECAKCDEAHFLHALSMGAKTDA